jgi:hypothetical protein
VGHPGLEGDEIYVGLASVGGSTRAVGNGSGKKCNLVVLRSVESNVKKVFFFLFQVFTSETSV